MLEFLRRDPLLALLTALAIVLTIAARPRLEELPGLLGLHAVLLVYSLSIVSVLFTESRLFRVTAARIAARLSARAALGVYTVIVGLASSVILNDVSCVVFARFSLLLAEALGLPASLVAVATALAANIGSSLTPIGNPQNILIWRYYGVSFAEFTLAMSVFALPSLALLAIYVYMLAPRVERGGETKPSIRVRIPMAVAALALLVLNIVLAEMGLEAELLAATVTLAASLLLIGAEGVGEPGIAAMLALFIYDFSLVSRILTRYHLLPASMSCLGAYAYSLILSQLVSNVPATVILLGRTCCWRALALGVNLAGVGVIHASLANLIVARLAGVKTREYHRMALPFFLALVALYTLLAATLYQHTGCPSPGV